MMDCANASFMSSSALNSSATTPSRLTDEATSTTVWAGDGAGVGAGVGAGDGLGLGGCEGLGLGRGVGL